MRPRGPKSSARVSARAAPSPLQGLGARDSPLLILSSPARSQLPRCARTSRAAAPSALPLPLRELPPARSSSSPFPGDAHARQAGSRPLAFLQPARPPPLPPRGAASRRGLLYPPPDIAGLPPPANGGSPASQAPSLPALSSGGPAPASSLPPFPLIPLPDAAIMLKPQPPQQTSQPQQPPPTQQAVARRPPGGTSPPNGGLPGPLASTSAPAGPPAAASPCLGPAAAAGSGLRRGAEGILAPQPPAAAAASGEAGDNGCRQRQVRRGGFPGAGAEAAGRLGSGPAAGTRGHRARREPSPATFAGRREAWGTPVRPGLGPLWS